MLKLYLSKLRKYKKNEKFISKDSEEKGESWNYHFLQNKEKSLGTYPKDLKILEFYNTLNMTNENIFYYEQIRIFNTKINLKVTLNKTSVVLYLNDLKSKKKHK